MPMCKWFFSSIGNGAYGQSTDKIFDIALSGSKAGKSFKKSDSDNLIVH